MAFVLLDTGARRVVVENARARLVLSSGHLVFERSDAILVAPFDLDGLATVPRVSPDGHAIAFLVPRGQDVDVIVSSAAVPRSATAHALPWAVAGAAGPREMRTAPLWGVGALNRFLHDGSAQTLDEALRRHDGQGRGARKRHDALSQDDRDALLAFLRSL